jgi:hypothetical protein
VSWISPANNDPGVCYQAELQPLFRLAVNNVGVRPATYHTELYATVASSVCYLAHEGTPLVMTPWPSTYLPTIASGERGTVGHHPDWLKCHLPGFNGSVLAINDQRMPATKPKEIVRQLILDLFH